MGEGFFRQRTGKGPHRQCAMPVNTGSKPRASPACKEAGRMDTKKRRKAPAACLKAAVAQPCPHRVRGYDGTACIAALYSVRQAGL